MTHSKLTVEVQGTHILVFLRGTCFKAKFRKQEAPWLGVEEYGPDDPGAAITLSEFRSLAWAAANEAADRLGWIKSCDELHRAAKRAGSSTDPQFDICMTSKWEALASPLHLFASAR
jgi:hypothetical protein